LKNPNVRAFLNTISWAEGADYDSLYGDLLKGRRITFSDYSRFPVRGTASFSGRYQIKDTTYDGLSVKLGLTDFSPHTQDLMAAELLVEKGVMKQLLAGDLNHVLPQVSHVWSSLSQGKGKRNYYPPQPYKTYEQIQSHFLQSLLQLQKLSP
jgi:muramidase (phage lysozyme)